MHITTEKGQVFGRQLLGMLDAAQFPGAARREVAELGDFIEALAAGTVAITPPAAAAAK